MSDRILVTGADGFVGGHLIKALADRPRHDTGVFAAQHMRKTVFSENVSAVELDVTDATQVDAIVRDVKPTCIIHLAAIAAVQDATGHRDRAWLVNLNGTRNLAEAVLKRTPRARFVFISTSELYGGTFKQWDRPLDESAVLDPTNTYAASKAAADLLIGQMVRDGLNAIRIRPFNHTGAGQTEAFVVPAFAAQIARIEAGLQEPVVRVGNLEAKRDFLDVRDVVDAYLRTIFHPCLAAGTIFNIASGVPRRIQDILQGLCELSTERITVEADPARMRPSDTPFAIGDAALAHDALRWRPKIPWETTLREVLAYWRKSKIGNNTS